MEKCAPVNPTSGRSVRTPTDFLLLPKVSSFRTKSSILLCFLLDLFSVTGRYRYAFLVFETAGTMQPESEDPYNSVDSLDSFGSALGYSSII